MQPNIVPITKDIRVCLLLASSILIIEFYLNLQLLVGEEYGRPCMVFIKNEHFVCARARARTMSCVYRRQVFKIQDTYIWSSNH